MIALANSEGSLSTISRFLWRPCNSKPPWCWSSLGDSGTHSSPWSTHHQRHTTTHINGGCGLTIGIWKNTSTFCWSTFWEHRFGMIRLVCWLCWIRAHLFGAQDGSSQSKGVPKKDHRDDFLQTIHFDGFTFYPKNIGEWWMVDYFEDFHHFLTDFRWMSPERNHGSRLRGECSLRCGINEEIHSCLWRNFKKWNTSTSSLENLPQKDWPILFLENTSIHCGVFIQKTKKLQ